MKLTGKVLVPTLLFFLSSSSYAQGCPSWMNCDQPAPARYTTLADARQVYNSSNYYTAPSRTNVYNSNYYSTSSSQKGSNYNNATFSASDPIGIWRDEYSAYDPRLMPERIKPTGKKIFIFSPKARQWGAYNSAGDLIAFGRANGGDHFCPDIRGVCNTPKGTYAVYRKGSADCISHSFPVGKGGAKMPYCMFFHNGYSIHGSPTLSLHNGSHGCIRVTIEAAQWLSSNFIDYGTKVVVLPYR